MKLIHTASGVILERERGDKALSHESTVTHHIRRLLNAAGGHGKWVRCYPDRIGLTSCRQGVRNTVTGAIYWHENYQIEEAHKAFNNNSVLFQKAIQ